MFLLVDDFIAMILSFPLEVEIISDSVYANSTTLDGRRFAEEFIRRRKLANQGVVTDAGPLSAGLLSGSAADSSNKSSSGGWSEVAKKKAEPQGQAQQQAEPQQFKVVAKKKGRR